MGFVPTVNILFSAHRAQTLGCISNGWGDHSNAVLGDSIVQSTPPPPRGLAREDVSQLGNSSQTSSRVPAPMLGPDRSRNTISESCLPSPTPTRPSASWLEAPHGGLHFRTSQQAELFASPTCSRYCFFKNTAVVV